MPILKTVEAWVCENCEKHLEGEDSICDCQPQTVKEKLKYCSGCYNNDYNSGLGGAKQCWSITDMVVVKRKRVHINQVPPWNQEPELLPKCYNIPKFIFARADQTF